MPSFFTLPTPPNTHGHIPTLARGTPARPEPQVLEDRPGEPGESGSVHSVTWRVPRPQNRPPLELTAEGRGATAAEAQVGSVGWGSASEGA